MPKDPHWTRDELILALDLYFKLGDVSKTREKASEIIELSGFLQSLPVHSKDRRTASFRNPNSVIMKLFNIMRLDPTYGGRGLGAGSRLDVEVWEEFHNDRERLVALADSIRRNRDAGEPTDDTPYDPEDDGADEGRMLARMHRQKERSSRLSRKKKNAILKTLGKLECEICGFDFAVFYGERGIGVAECHHIIPLEDLEGVKRTKLADLAIVCANCHRILHRGKPRPSMKELRQELVELGIIDV